jgi:hypothetical protein
MPSVLGNGVLLGLALAGAQYTGGAVFSQRSDPDEDKFVTKEEVRRRFRRPVNEMINEIGEGRGNSSVHSCTFEDRMRHGPSRSIRTRGLYTAIRRVTYLDFVLTALLQVFTDPDTMNGEGRG